MLALHPLAQILLSDRLHILNPDVTACSRWTISDHPLNIVREVGRTPSGASGELRCHVGSPLAVGKHLLVKDATGELAVRKSRTGSETKKRDDAMFAELIGPSQERVYRLALRITRNTEDAEDVQQETLLKVHRKLGQFEGRSRLTTWISRIAINEALMCLRKRRSAFYTPLEETLPPAEETALSEEFQQPIEGPEAAYSRKELRELLKQAMEKLRPAYRVVFLLRAVEQLSTSEAAKVLQISASAVKARMRRARSELREWLEQAWRARLHDERTIAAARQWLI
jgi:RNA polymerase sigma-70 factor (ECF subfamily)